MEQWISKEALHWIYAGSGIVLVVIAIAVPFLPISPARQDFKGGSYATPT